MLGTPCRISVLVFGSMRISRLSGTCLMQTTMCITSGSSSSFDDSCQLVNNVTSQITINDKAFSEILANEVFILIIRRFGKGCKGFVKKITREVLGRDRPVPPCQLI